MSNYKSYRWGDFPGPPTSPPDDEPVNRMPLSAQTITSQDIVCRECTHWNNEECDLKRYPIAMKCKYSVGLRRIDMFPPVFSDSDKQQFNKIVEDNMRELYRTAFKKGFIYGLILGITVTALIILLA